MARAVPPTRAGGDVDHVASAIEFVHIALGSSPVLVKQSLEPVADGRDATARWVWNGAFPHATFLCEHPEYVKNKTVVELGAGPGLPGVVAGKLGAKRVVLTDLPDELELPLGNLRVNGLNDDGGDVVEQRCSVEPCTWGVKSEIDKLGKFDIVLCSDVLYGHHENVAVALAQTAHALCAVDGRMLLSYFPREKLEFDQPFFNACDVLFEDPTPRNVDGVSEEIKHDLWLFEYRPKRGILGGV